QSVSLKSINLKLRVNEPVSFSVSLKAAENFPLDLYMLMDLSETLYTESLTQDYPSIEQVRQALEDANLVPVFAVAASSNSSEKILKFLPTIQS
ncbi:integrin beta-1-like, partial [Gigantopelta aegis]|uniref:integrin beta-1-like n=1 Tax=Gigantopelta aegis TaxID=1735272 RepID=UPI001B88A15D